MRRDGPMTLGLFLNHTGHHVASWRHPGAQVDANVNRDHYLQLARTAEEAKLDFVFFADSVATRQADMEALSRSAQYTAYFEPITLLSAMSVVTKSLGLITTATTSYYEPYQIARLFASLDHLSGGRAGWNVVTSSMQAEAQNFGRDAHFGHAERYRRAHEFMDVVKGLWDSWDDDAWVRDRESGVYFDPAKMHVLDHVGEHFKVRGPLNVPRPVQGYPVLVQAGSSEDGRDFAASMAEIAFTSELTLEAARQYSDDVRARMVKSEERLQDVPLTITALTSETIQKTDTKTLYDLATRTPGLFYGTTGGRSGGNKLQIRNFSTGTVGGSKASVFIDGVFIAGDYNSTPLANLERIEVLKGPQSAYFGRSTFVGAVNFVTKDPGADFEGRLEGVLATLGETDFTGYITTPILGDQVSNTVTGRVYQFRGPDEWTGRDGYHHGDQSTRAISDKLVFRPMDGLTIRWYNSYIKDRDHLPQTSYAPLNTRNSRIVRPDGRISYYFQGPVKIDHSAANAVNLYQVRVLNGGINNAGVNRKQYRSVLSFDADIAGQTLSGYAAYGNETLRNNLDITYIGARTIVAPNASDVLTTYTSGQTNSYGYYKTKDHQYEIRLSAPQSWPVRYLIGYNRTEINGRQRFLANSINVAGVITTPAFSSANNSTIIGNPSKTDGIFGGLYADIGEKITVSAELRHQWDNISTQQYNAAGVAVVDLQKTFKATLPRLNVQYQPNRNINIYAVYSQGNNPGGFNANILPQFLPAGVSQAYGEEKLYNYEAGIKTTWLDGRLTFNLAAYHMDWKNQQVQQSYSTPGAATAITALFTGGAASKVTGFEAELNARVAPEFNLRATASYGKAKYVTYCSSNYYALTGVATSLGCRSVAGFQQEGTPAFQASLFADYETSLTDKLDGYIRADYQYQSRIYLEEWDASWTAPAHLMGLRVGIETGNLGLELFARNLLNDDHSPRVTRATFAFFGVGGSACSIAQTNAVPTTCAAANYPAPVTPAGQTTAGSAGNQSIADTARRPRQIGLKATVKF